MVLTYLEIKAGVYDEPYFQFLRFLDDSHIFFVLIGNVVILLKLSFPSRNAKCSEIQASSVIKRRSLWNRRFIVELSRALSEHHE